MPARENTKHSIKHHKEQEGLAGLLHLKGFTLVEILVSIAILASLSAGVFLAIRPKTQIDKANDTTRQQDLSSIKSNLDLYYHDKNCYPSLTSSVSNDFADALKNGTQWKEGNTLYMQKVPKDPVGDSYTYVTDSTVCPQWSVLFSKFSKEYLVDSASGATPICSLSQSASKKCVPNGFDSSWGCVISGDTQCTTLLATSLPGAPASSYTPTTNPSGTVAPTPTSVPTSQSYYVAMPPGTNPQFYQGLIDPLFQAVDKTQKFSVDVADSAGNVTSVSMTAKTDTKTQTFTLDKTAGTGADGTWSKTITVNDTTINRYMLTFTGTDSAGNTSSFDLSIR